MDVLDQIDGIKTTIQKMQIDIELIKKDVDQYNILLVKLDNTNTKLQSLIENSNTIINLHNTKLVLQENEIDQIKENMEPLQKAMNKFIHVTWAIGAIGFLMTVLSNFGFVINTIKSLFNG